MNPKAILLLISLCCSSLTTSAITRRAPQQQQPTAPPAKQAETETAPSRSGKTSGNAPTVLAAMDEDYRIGPNDVIEIQVEEAPELSGARKVNANGTFLMNYLGRLPAKGKTTEELSQIIADGLRQRYLYDPRVTVTVQQFNSRSFFIQGAVRSPGVYQIEGRPTLLELLTVAGGLGTGHGSTAYVIRKIKASAVAAQGGESKLLASALAEDKAAITTPSNASASVQDTDPDPRPQYTLLKANLVGLLRGRFELNMFLEPGDIVNVPQTDVFFVAGEVKAPGSFPLKDGTTLRQAISLAQGTTFKAAGNRTTIFRENPDTGQRLELHLDLGAVMSGKAEDQVILANDIIIVPNSKLKSITAPMLNALGMSAVRLPIP
jgi:polysaccharide biosynthesis/export protein